MTTTLDRYPPETMGLTRYPPEAIALAPIREEGESMLEFARRRSAWLRHYAHVNGAKASPSIDGPMLTFDADLVPDVSLDRETVRYRIDDVLGVIDIVQAYNRWCGKSTCEPGSKRESIMVSCPRPEHADKHPSAWLNLDKGPGGVGNCSQCGGFDKYDIAAWHFGFPVPEYKSKDFPKLRARMAESLGFKSDVRGRDEWREVAPSMGTALTASAGRSTALVAPPLTRLSLVSAANVRLKRASWLWTGRIPIGALTLTPGRGGIGKSTAHAWFIARVTRGDLPGCYEGTPKSVIVAATEDSWEYTIAPRLVAAGADLSRVYRIEVESTEGSLGTISLPADVDELSELILRHEVVLMSVDPLIAFLNEQVDSHRDKEVRDALRPLTKMAEETGCVILGNAHFTKSGTDPMTSIMGSAAFGNVARAALAFAFDAEAGAGVMSQVKNNLGSMHDLPSLRYRLESTTIVTDDGPSEVGLLVWDGTSSRSVGDILGDTRSAEDRSSRRDAQTFILDYLVANGGSAPAGEVIAAGIAEGHPDRTLKRARHQAGVITRQLAGHHLWTLPPIAETSAAT